MCQSTYRYAKANKYMKKFDKNQKSCYLEYLDSNNLYGWAMNKKLPLNGFEWIDDLSVFNKEFIKNYDEHDDVGYYLEVDIEYPKNFQKLHSDLSFLPERRKIGKVEKHICAIEDKKEYTIHILALKQALNHGLRLTNVHRVIRFIKKHG